MQRLAFNLLIWFTLISIGHGKPNILWIYVEDMSPWISCYGDNVNQGKTPHIDALAERGVKFTRTFVPAPVCSPCRSAIITGAFQTTTGTHNHRSSGKPSDSIRLPEGYIPLPIIFKKHGYQCFNVGKEDYNFVFDRKSLYQWIPKKSIMRPWSELKKPETPWFGQIQLYGGKHDATKCNDRVDPSTVTPPPYFPDTELFKKWHAWHYDTVRMTDDEVGTIMKNLKEDGLLENTIVFFFTDHGNNHSVRAKQFCTESGTHVPLIIAGPNPQLKAGTTRKDLVSLLDIGATSLGFCDISIPEKFESLDLFAADFKPRQFVVSARDRCDYTIDKIRSVRTEKFRYIKNFLTDRPVLQPQYRDDRDYVIALRKGHADGTLPELTDKIFFGPRPSEELYDLEKDPHEINNLAKDPAYASILAEHRNKLNSWIKETGDKGMLPEPENTLKAAYKRWGKRCINPEFDRVRK